MVLRRLQVDNVHVNCLRLLQFGRNGAQPVAHLIAGLGHVFALNAGGREIQRIELLFVRATEWQLDLLGNVNEYILTARSWRYKAVALGSTERLYHPLLQRVVQRTHASTEE